MKIRWKLKKFKLIFTCQSYNFFFKLITEKERFEGYEIQQKNTENFGNFQKSIIQKIKDKISR